MTIIIENSCTLLMLELRMNIEKIIRGWSCGVLKKKNLKCILFIITVNSISIKTRKMKLKVDKSESFKWAIVVNEMDLRRLDETIKSIIGSEEEKNISILYKIKCSDGSKVETSDINDVVNEENLKSRSIENIEIVAYEKELNNSINISLGRGGYFQSTPISYSITGDSREWVYVTASKIEERIEGLKQWYSFFYKLNYDLSMTIIIIFFMMFIGVQPEKEISENTGNISLIVFLKGFLILVTILLIIYLIYKLIKSSLIYLFPETVFRIGEGKKRHDTITDLRGKLFWVIFVGLIISIISGVILIKFV